MAPATPSPRSTMCSGAVTTWASSSRSEAQRVRDDGDVREAHRDRGDEWAQEKSGRGIEHAGGERNSESVVAEREAKVLPDVAHGGTAQLAGADDAVEVAFDQRDLRALHRDIRAGAHGD